MEIFKKYIAVIISLYTFIIYLTTVAPSVVQIDSGELAAVQATLGIAHPTGYPLYTIIGYLFSLIPLPFTKIFQLNLLAALYCSIGVGIFSITSKLVLDNLDIFSTKKNEVKKKEIKQTKKNITHNKLETKKIIIPEPTKYIAISFSALALAFSRTFWFQSTSVEVYSLHILLINLIILFLVKAFVNKNDNPKSETNSWLLFAVFLALGFSNHMTTLLILPGTAYLYFNKNKFNTVSFKRLALMLLIFFPILFLIYSYLPIRASQNPSINWGNPIDLERIMRHVSGKQYQVWLFSSTEAAKKQLTYFINNLPTEFFITLIIASIGLFTSYKISKKFFIFTLITFFSTVLYSINYDINDIDSYFLLAYISLAFFVVFGTIKIIELLLEKKIKYSFITFVLVIILSIQIYSNYSEVNQSRCYTFEDYTKALLNSTSQNSIVFGYEWDYYISESYYFQYVENFRKDITVIDKELMRRSWYYNQIKTDHPDVLNGVQDVEKLFLKSLVPFERDEDYNPNIIENYYRQLMTGLVAANFPKKDFYVASEIYENEMQQGQFKLPPGLSLVPDLLLFKVVKGNQYVPAKDPDFTIRFPKNRNRYIDLIERMVATMLARRAMYELQFNKLDRAKVYINKIKSNFPNFTIPTQLQGIAN